MRTSSLDLKVPGPLGSSNEFSIIGVDFPKTL